MGGFQLRLRDFFWLVVLAALVAMVCRSGWSPFSFGVIFFQGLAVCGWLRFVSGRRQLNAGLWAVAIASFTTAMVGMVQADGFPDPLAVLFGLSAGAGIGMVVGLFSVLPCAVIPERPVHYQGGR